MTLQRIVCVEKNARSTAPEPFPGSTVARAHGCVCPAVQPADGSFLVETACPVHVPRPVSPTRARRLLR